ncbi:hypothetical protein O181_030251 [Austropuccinia psidii MF-1]|uniref:Uncharacterized protein n=1 Tax=Austropuccinia psidii MF-1 TaxID=1389203 RepID=A0A9Q3CY40_9BASI|nr:hypothetical protein [Austropuccinia psidii MF-1]
METSTPYTEKSTLPRRVNISTQRPTPSHQEITRNTTPIVEIRDKDYNLPRNPSPPSSSTYQPCMPAQMAPSPPLKVPIEGNESAKNTVRAFAKEQAELKKKFMEKPTVKPKPEEEFRPTETKLEDKLTSIANAGYFSNWKPPTIFSSNDHFESHIELRQTKQRMERQAQNQEPKKKAAIPGTYIEEERVIIPTKFQNSNITKPDQPEEEIENIANKNEDEEIPKEKRSSENLKRSKLKPN